VWRRRQPFPAADPGRGPASGRLVCTRSLGREGVPTQRRTISAIRNGIGGADGTTHRRRRWHRQSRIGGCQPDLARLHALPPARNALVRAADSARTLLAHGADEAELIPRLVRCSEVPADSISGVPRWLAGVSIWRATLQAHSAAIPFRTSPIPTANRCRNVAKKSQGMSRLGHLPLSKIGKRAVPNFTRFKGFAARPSSQACCSVASSETVLVTLSCDSRRLGGHVRAPSAGPGELKGFPASTQDKTGNDAG
jgi:hypothetical protein